MADKGFMIPVVPLLKNISAGVFISELEKNYWKLAGFSNGAAGSIADDLIDFKMKYEQGLGGYKGDRKIELISLEDFLNVLSRRGHGGLIENAEVAVAICAYIDNEMVKNAGKRDSEITTEKENELLKTYILEGNRVFIGTDPETSENKEYIEKVNQVYGGSDVVWAFMEIILGRISFHDKPEIYKARPLL